MNETFNVSLPYIQIASVSKLILVYKLLSNIEFNNIWELCKIAIIGTKNILSQKKLLLAVFIGKVFKYVCLTYYLGIVKIKNRPIFYYRLLYYKE